VIRIFVTVWLALLWLTAPALAEPPPSEKKKFDLTFRRPGHPDTWLRPNVRWDAAWFAGFNAWGGNTEENIGDETHGFGEIGLVPAIDGQFSLGEHGTIHGRVSGVFTTTQIGLDFAGSNFYNGKTQSPSKITLEDVYLRWTSGELVPTLGKDAIDLSVGAQTYQIGPGDLGNGFIFHKGGYNGGRRGGFWLGLRNAFELTGIARLKTGAFAAEAVYLRADEGSGVHTNLAGVNFDYDFGELLNLELARLGFGYWNLFDSDNERRDGLNVINARLDIKPCRRLPGLRFTGEMVKEKNGSKNDSWGAWGELGYDFQDAPWKPYVSYRYAYFSGEDLRAGDNEAFDPLFYGYNDWNYWYIGEIAGEWVTGNSNLQASIVRLRVNPIESLTAQLFWIYQRVDQLEGTQIPPGGIPPPTLDPRVLDITDKDLSHEINLIFDWTVNDYLSMSFVGAVLIPLKGGKEFFGDDKAWGQFMLYWSVNF
jgi:hypothetical protein